MMPEIVFLIPILAIVGWVLTEVSSSFFDYLKQSRGGAVEGASLTTSELEGLIAEAVEEANRELSNRIEVLEAQRDAPRERPLLDAEPGNDHVENHAASRATRKRVS